MKQFIKFVITLLIAPAIIIGLLQCKALTDNVFPQDLIDSLAQKAVMVFVNQKRDSLDSLLRNQLLLPTLSPLAPTRIGSDSIVVDSNISCTHQKYKIQAGDENSILLDATTDLIAPGALIDASSIDDGRYMPFLWSRAPIVISMNSVNASHAVDTILDPAKKSSAQEAINRLMSQPLKGKIPAKMTREVIKVYSREQAAIAIGANLNGSNFQVAGKFKWENDKIHQRFIVKFYQECLNISVDLPARPVDLFKGQLNIKLLGQYSPALVSNVKYGRICLFLFETESEDASIEASLNASYSALTVGGSVSADLKLHSIMEKSTVKTLTFGGDPTLAAQVVDPPTLDNFITQSAEFTPNSQPVMISYTLRSIKDNSVLRIVKGTEYVVRNCIVLPPPPPPLSKKIKMAILTGGDDLRGGNNAFFTINMNDGTRKPEILIGGGFGNNSNVEKEFDLPFELRLNEIKSITIRHDGNPRSGLDHAFDTYDNWNLDAIQISLISIAGKEFNLYNSLNDTDHRTFVTRFTGDNRTITLEVQR